MSRKYAAFLDGVVEALNALQPASQREKSRALLMLKLEGRNVVRVETKRGELVFQGARGRRAWLMAHHFLEDEPETLDWLDAHVKPDEVLWDIGAAIGAFSLYAARGGTRVFAFEPKATSLGLLTEHIAANGVADKVSALGLALSDSTGFGRLDIEDVAPGGAFNSLAGSSTQFGERRGTFPQATIMVTADDAVSLLHVPPPDHIKLDVDGIEDRILLGATKTLQTVKSVIVEVEGEAATHAAERIDRPLNAAGLVERPEVRSSGSRRNRLFVRA